MINNLKKTEKHPSSSLASTFLFFLIQYFFQLFQLFWSKLLLCELI